MLKLTVVIANDIKDEDVGWEQKKQQLSLLSWWKKEYAEMAMWTSFCRTEEITILGWTICQVEAKHFSLSHMEDAKACSAFVLHLKCICIVFPVHL